jgi:hypothetical protein
LDAWFSKGYNSMSQGLFKVSVDGNNYLLQGFDVEAAEIYTSLDSESNKYIVVAYAALFLHSMNGVVTILVGRQAAGRHSEPRRPCLPTEIIETSAKEFVSLVSSQKALLRSDFDDEFLQAVCQQQKELVRVTAQEPALIAQRQSMLTNIYQNHGLRVDLDS